MSLSQQIHSRDDVLWYCCHCAYGGMSLELHPKCISCDQKRCEFCTEEEEEEEESMGKGKHMGKKAPLCSASKNGSGAGGHEALRHKPTTPISRAPTLLQPDCTTMMPFLGLEEPQAVAPGSETSIFSSQKETGLIGWNESDNSNICQDGERSPRSEADDSFPMEPATDAYWEKLLFGQGTINPEDLSAPQPDWGNEALCSDGTIGIVPPLPEFTADLNPSAFFQVPFNDNFLEVQEAPNYLQSAEPQLPTASGAYFPGTPQHPTLWKDAATTNPQPSPFSSITPQISDVSHQPSSHTPLHSAIDQELPQNINKRKRSEAHGDGQIDRIPRACNSCQLATKSDQEERLACLFYKRNPARFSSCMHKSFRTISSLGQHLVKHHKLGRHHCTSCWSSFEDRRSLAAHTNCQPTGGIPVDKLEITKTRHDPITKWYWIWGKLFGKTIPSPCCPHPHPEEDIAAQVLAQFVQHLKEKGTRFNIVEIEYAIPQWLASYPGPTTSGQLMDIVHMLNTPNPAIHSTSNHDAN
ncbi:hypothetical protein GGR54DRAFT_506690 [Hypoxylon sp. NC1633]|nr:hypothetical protein GGR54DRAFT_506690 [Hypoxylon sp. NC1633]